MNKKKLAIIIAAAVAAVVLIAVGIVIAVAALNKDGGSGVTWTPERESSSEVADASGDVEEATKEQEEPEEAEDDNTGYSYSSVPNPLTGQSQWTKEKSVSQIVDIKNVLKMLTTMENVEKVSDSQYRIKMSASEVQGLMNNSDVDASGISGTIDVDVYVSNGYIAKMEYDFSKMFTSYNKFKTTITFSDYNNAGDVNIPQSVVDSAVTTN